MNSIPESSPTIDLKRDLKGRICPLPFASMELHLDEGTYVCCPSWMKKSIGNFYQNDILDIWNSQSAQDIRASILDGSYRYCNHEVCPHILGGTLPTFWQLDKAIQDDVENEKTILNRPPQSVMFTFDSSCNLSCPSCRPEKNSLTADSPVYKKLNELCHSITEKLLKDPNAHVRVNISGSGDPFASLAFRHYLEQIDGEKHPNLIFDLQTNGLLFTPLMWQRMSKIHKNIGKVHVSIDAATAETYSIVRRGGKWETLLENMEFMSKLRQEGKFPFFQLNFVVQQKNYREVPDFIRLFLKYKPDSFYYSKIDDWGAYPPAEFPHQCVWEENHPDYEHFLSVLADPILSHHKVTLGNVTPYVELAQKKKSATLDGIEQITYTSKNYFKRKAINLAKKIKKALKIYLKISF